MRIQFYALLIATILCVSCQRSSKPSEVWPTKAWLYSSAEEQGMRIQRLIDAAQDDNISKNKSAAARNAKAIEELKNGNQTKK